MHVNGEKDQIFYGIDEFISFSHLPLFRFGVKKQKWIAKDEYAYVC